jgi:hypothetical protein
MFLVLLSLFTRAEARELEGVSMPDIATVGGQSVLLNGMGLREKFFLNIYVGALYLPAKTTDAKAAIDQDVAKKMVMSFQYSGGVPKDKMIEAYEEGLSSNAGAMKSSQAANFQKFYGWLSDMAAGDQIVYEYVPGKGTTVSVKGAVKGTIEGTEFMKALFSIYLGATPPTGPLKAGLLGG